MSVLLQKLYNYRAKSITYVFLGLYFLLGSYILYRLPTIHDLILYATACIIIVLVSWASNHQIERALTRALDSEKLLRSEQRLLEIKVRQRTRELEKAQVETIKGLYRFAEFGRLSSSLLHDLANPLTVLSLNVSALEADQESEAVSQVRQGISHIEEYVASARRQLRCQTDNKIFDSKVEAERVCKLLKTKANANNINLKVRLVSGAALYGDSTKFNQAITNLIANAIDAYAGNNSRSRHTVTVRSRVSRRSAVLMVAIEDKGIGIAPGQLERIFEPFHTTKSSDQGTGIGLSIVKRIIQDDFGGEVRVMSSKGTGTTFTVRLPLSIIKHPDQVLNYPVSNLTSIESVVT